MKRILCALLFVFGLLTSAWADSSRYASDSVLNSGKWVKIQVAEAEFQLEENDDACAEPV